MSETDLVFPQVPQALLESTDDVVVTLRDDIYTAYREAAGLFREFTSLGSAEEAVDRMLASPDTGGEAVSKWRTLRNQLERLTQMVETAETQARAEVKATLHESDRSPEVVLALYKRQRNAIEDFRIPGVFDSVCEVLNGWSLPTPAEVKAGKKSTPRGAKAAADSTNGNGNVRLVIEKVTAKSENVDVEYDTMSQMSVDMGWDNQAVSKHALAVQGNGRSISKVVTFEWNGVTVTVYPKGWGGYEKALYEQKQAEVSEPVSDTADADALIDFDFEAGDFE